MPDMSPEEPHGGHILFPECVLTKSVWQRMHGLIFASGCSFKILAVSTGFSLRFFLCLMLRHLLTAASRR